MSMRNCKKCGKPVNQIAADCPHCKETFSHRDCYPDQYAHPSCGKKVRVVIRLQEVTQGKIERVVLTRFGVLAHLDTSGAVAYPLADCHEIEDTVYCPTHGARRKSIGTAIQREVDETCVYICAACLAVCSDNPIVYPPIEEDHAEQTDPS